MKKQQVGLVIEGNSTSSTLLRLPGVASELGPIKGSGFQVARRVSNFLRAGHAVHTYSELESARTILLRVPDQSIERTVADICAQELAWAEHTFILCETWAPTMMLDPLRKLGAGAASLVQVPSGRNKTFVVEGDITAMRQLKRIIGRTDASTIELRPGSKHLLFAASVLCTAVPVPLLVMAQQALRDGGASGNQLAGMIQDMSINMLNGFLKGARVKWGGPIAETTDESQLVYWRQLRETHPELSESLSMLVNWSQNQILNR